MLARVQLVLASLPVDTAAMMRNGVFDEDTLANLAGAWRTDTFDVGEGSPEAAAIDWRAALHQFRTERRAERDQSVRAGTISNAEIAAHARATLDWEATWIPVSELVERALKARQGYRLIAGAAGILRSDARWGVFVALLITTEILASFVARIDSVGIGAQPSLNIVIGGILAACNGGILIGASIRVRRIVHVLTA